MSIESCKGCTIPKDSHCTIRYKGLESKCPCQNCIVKVMCHNYCEKSKELHNWIRKNWTKHDSSVKGVK